MRVLIVGAGVIGTVYGAHLAGAGHAVSVLSHPPRTEDVARNGLIAHDVLEGSRTGARASVVSGAAGTLFDLVLVAVRSDQRAAACSELTGLAGSPAVVFFGNNPEGQPAVRSTVMSCSGSPAWASRCATALTSMSASRSSSPPCKPAPALAWISWPRAAARAGSRSSA
jgi:2-dehydropantoate 2-reductase